MREKWLDNTKAVAIFLVVFAHCLTEVEGHFVLQMANDFIYSFHMPVLFALSGYVSAINKKTIKKTILKKEIIKKYVTSNIRVLSFGSNS